MTHDGGAVNIVLVATLQSVKGGETLPDTSLCVVDNEDNQYGVTACAVMFCIA
jgi:hypothetical protein